MMNEKAKEKKWILKGIADSDSRTKAAKIADALGLNPIVARLLYSRGFTDATSAKEFIYMEKEMLCNPFEMKDMQLAISRIKRALDNREHITIYGDYDVDGVTSVCTLYLYLKSYGARVSYYIPNRAGEGYGVSKVAIDAIRSSGSSLIITVDTGITANEEIEYAKSIGVDVVITDHHECRSELPQAEAVVNPHRPDCTYPFKELAGVGVVFKLICAYEEYVNNISRIEAAERVFDKYADFVAIGTIADVMPIRSENRIIVSYGLSKIENTDRAGLLAIIEASAAGNDNQRDERPRKKQKITSGYIGYTLAPRINAAGRVRTASMAVELFLEKDYDKAYKIARELCLANKERQAEENKIMREAYKKMEGMDIDANPVIVLDADDWHHGVIGIVSSRITERFFRPSILISFEGSEQAASAGEAVGKGSGRSIKGMNLVDALCYCDEHLVKFGGHELAAGLSVTRGSLEAFTQKINEYARGVLTPSDMIPTLEADDIIEFKDINLALAESLQILEPYGVGNPIPAFIIKGVKLVEIAGVGGGKHTRMVFGDGHNTVGAIYFSNSPASVGLYAGDTVDVMFTIDINEWYGRRTAQLVVKDIRPSQLQNEALLKERARFDEIWNGAPFDSSEGLLPTRDDFASVYKLAVASVRSGVDTLAHRDIISKLAHNRSDIGYIKLKIIVKVFCELNLLGIEEVENEVYKFSVHYSSTKTDLEKSNLLKRLRQQQRNR